jgi:DNA primase
MIDEMVTKECARLEMDRVDYRFSRRDVRRHTGWGNTQLKTHLGRLEDLEYLLVHHGGRGQSFVYELLFERSATDDKPVLPGLIDVEKLRYDGNRSGVEGDKSGSSRPQVGGVSGGGRVKPEPIKTGMRSRFSRFNGKNTDTGQREKEPVVIVAAGGR